MHASTFEAWTSSAFEDSEAFMARMRQKSADLCIIDLNLGTALKGWDLIQSLRVDQRLLAPIVITSTSTDASIIAHAIEMGASDYLIKPLDKDVLTAKLLRFFTTDLLEMFKLSGSSASRSTQIETTLALDTQVSEVDETGVTLLSKHLINKGTVIRLEGELVREITGEDKPLLVTVAAASVDVGRAAYSIYLEFDSLDQATYQSVRNWITRQTPG